MRSIASFDIPDNITAPIRVINAICHVSVEWRVSPIGYTLEITVFLWVYMHAGQYGVDNLNRRGFNVPNQRQKEKTTDSRLDKVFGNKPFSLWEGFSFRNKGLIGFLKW
jgi:hypothetical protein